MNVIKSRASNTAVIVFVYNRPTHTARLFESVQRARYTNSFRFYVYSDGPKTNNPDDFKKVSSVRSVCEKFSENINSRLHKYPKNKGLAESIVSGVNDTLRKYERVIVLEDDLVLHPSFFEFMDRMLHEFNNTENVWHISGYMIPTLSHLPAIGLYRVPGSWGWATWRRAWKHYEHNTHKLLNAVKEKGINEFNIEGTYDHYGTLLENEKGERCSWAIRWYASMFLHNGLSVYPSHSLIDNTGFDGSGTNCGADNVIQSLPRMKHSELWRNSLQIDHRESAEYKEAFKQFYIALQKKWITKPGLVTRVRNRLKISMQKLRL